MMSEPKFEPYYWMGCYQRPDILEPIPSSGGNTRQEVINAIKAAYEKSWPQLKKDGWTVCKVKVGLYEEGK